MNWYKHDTNAITDAKIRKLIMRYGAEGYAIYFHCLELIASGVSESNITFELEHDAEIIADNLKIKSTPDCAAIDKVNEIMKYIVLLNLFQENDGRIFCFKLLKRLDSSMTSSQKFRSMIQKAKDSHDNIMINHDDIMQDKIRIDKIRIDKKEKERKGKFTPPLPTEVQEYLNERNITSFTGQYFCDWNSARGWMIGKNKMKDWKAAVRTWEQREEKKEKQHYEHPLL